MKKSILMGIFALFTITSSAQLKVKSDGTVETGRVLINEKDSVYWNGDYALFCSLYGDSLPATAICARVDGNPSPMSVASTAIGIRGEAVGSETSYGIKAYASGSTAYGVYGYTPTYNGCLNYGAAIYGTLYSQPKIFANNYAGFFDGPVAITTGLYVRGGTYTNFSYNTLNESPLLPSSLDKSSQPSAITEKLSSLQLGCYLEENEIEENANNGFKKSGSDIQENENIHYGLYPEQLEETFPSLVVKEKNGDKYINYIELVPLLVQAINELSAKVATLEAELGIQDPKKPVLKAKEQATAIGDAEMDVVTMSQNKPNPFSDSSVITLNIPETTKAAVIVIYDMSGKQVRTINVVERGLTNITVYAAGLTPGMYVYNLIVDGKLKATRKMIVQNC